MPSYRHPPELPPRAYLSSDSDTDEDGASASASTSAHGRASEGAASVSPDYVPPSAAVILPGASGSATAIGSAKAYERGDLVYCPLQVRYHTWPAIPVFQVGSTTQNVWGKVWA